MKKGDQRHNRIAHEKTNQNEHDIKIQQKKNLREKNFRKDKGPNGTIEMLFYWILCLKSNSVNATAAILRTLKQYVHRLNSREKRI